MRLAPMTPMVLAIAFAGGAAAAQPLDPVRAAVFRSPAAAADRSEPPRAFGVAKTAVDHRFDRTNLDGSAGFLCGLQPKARTDGAAAAYGVDPSGRFLGVKLHLSFR